MCDFGLGLDVPDANLSLIVILNNHKSHHLKSPTPSTPNLSVDDQMNDSGVGEQLVMSLSDKDLCIKCGEGGVLLACSDVDCPLAYHKECVPQALSICIMDNFYCPCCSYRKASTGTNKTKKSVMLAKKNLLLFLGSRCPTTTTTQKQKAPEGSCSPIILGEMTCDENADGPFVHSGHLENDQEVERAFQVDQLETDNPNIPHVEDQARLESSPESSRKRKSNDKRSKMKESSRLRKRKLTSPDEGNIKEKDGTVAGVEMRSAKHKDKTTSSRITRSRSMKQKGKTVEHKEEVQDSLEPSMENRLIIREPSLNVEHKEKTTASTSSESKPHLFIREKRKRCLWRVEEEEMLKSGVEKFSKKINKNIPWKKLLEFGRDVFDNSRNSSDLKDKWKNIQAKNNQPPPSDK